MVSDMTRFFDFHEESGWSVEVWDAFVVAQVSMHDILAMNKTSGVAPSTEANDVLS